MFRMCKNSKEYLLFYGIFSSIEYSIESQNSIEYSKESYRIFLYGSPDNVSSIGPFVRVRPLMKGQCSKR